MTNRNNYRNVLTAACLTLLAMLFAGCDDKIDLTAEYEDITVSYGMMNKSDSVHYFKIYRGFITDENAYTEAGNWDNVYYPVDSLEVRVEVRNENGALVRSVVLDTTTAIAKKQGYFAAPKQLLYCYKDSHLNEDNKYRLVIKRVNSGKEIYAETTVVGDFAFRYPMQNWNMTLDTYTPIKFKAAANASIYDLYLTFYYIEENKKSGEVAHKSFTKKLNSAFIRSSATEEVAYTGFTPISFYTLVSQSISPNEDVVRYIDGFSCIRLTAWAANEIFANYYDISNPTSSIVQSRGSYTNFVSAGNDDAFGFLASRNSCQRTFTWSSSIDHNEDTLVSGKRTAGLQFRYYREYLNNHASDTILNK